MNQIKKPPQVRRNPEEMARKIAVNLALHDKGLSRSELMAIEDFGVDTATFWRWLTKAKELEYVDMEGGTSTAKWVVSEKFRRELAVAKIREPLHRRPIVTYNELWLKSYVPNETYYLSEEARNTLEERCPLNSARLADMDPDDLMTFMCGLPYASSRLEGNQYTMLATVDLIERGIQMPGASPLETQMIMNHHRATDFLVKNISCPPNEDDVSITGRDIRTLHELLADNLLRDQEMCGKFRNNPVLIQESSYRPLEMRHMIESNFNTIMDKASAITNPFEQAFFMVVHLPYLQPFVDCNKRTSRLVCNIPLLRAGVAPMSWMDIESSLLTDALLCVYELNQTDKLADLFTHGYLRSVERFNIMKHSQAPREAITRYATELKDYVTRVVFGRNPPIPAKVEEALRADFIARANSDLEKLANFEAAQLHHYNLRRDDIEDWIKETQSDEERHTDRQRAA